MLAAIRRSSSLSGPRPLLQYPRALSDRQPDVRPMLDSAGEDFAGPTETVTGIEQAIDLRPIPRPLLDLVEIAVVREDCAIGHLLEVDVMGFRFFGHGITVAPSRSRSSADRGYVASTSRPYEAAAVAATLSAKRTLALLKATAGHLSFCTRPRTTASGPIWSPSAPGVFSPIIIAKSALAISDRRPLRK
jgi:hypothetical protein